MDRWRGLLKSGFAFFPALPLPPPDRGRDHSRHRGRPSGANPDDFRSSQIGVFTGSLIILAITLVFVRWIGATRCSQLLGIGLLWGGLTLAFEILFGRFVVGASWERLLSDYSVMEGGLLPFGMVVVVLSPWIVGEVRGVV